MIGGYGMVPRGELISSRREDGSREASLARFESDALHQTINLIADEINSRRMTCP